jgi:hypothetical protein
MLRLALAFALLLPAGPALASGVECMGSGGEMWTSIEAPAEIRAGHCPATIELASGLARARYSLAAPPEQLPEKTVCHYIWVPGSGGRLEPGNSIFTLICTLNR